MPRSASHLLRRIIIPTSMASHRNVNRLAKEKSPYLLQHCNNPVDWYPWGKEAFALAKQRNVPIFLSVGYSTCHWCHVMEHESFEDERIGKILNDNFVSIKVDREERPDVDKLYMSFVQAMTGGGGWPMSVFLTPELEPITGSTYFPPTDSHGRMGFSSVLNLIADKWKNSQTEVKEQGRAMAAAIKKGLEQAISTTNKALSNSSQTKIILSCFDHLSNDFDSIEGGFGRAPKFPKPVDLDFLLFNYYANTKEKQALEMVEKTLKKMAAGGIHDHVGKGFHRYSVDGAWHVPHFEKMLYDQGQLLTTYSNFYKATGQLGEVIIDIAEYLKDNLTHKEGGFYCAEDADSLPIDGAPKKMEGAFCVWSKKEVEQVLGNKPLRHNENVTLDELTCNVFQIDEGGNVPKLADPHGELSGQNVLKMVDECKLLELAKEYHMSIDKFNECIADAKRFLAERRATRPKPHLDNKILTSWNALAISGLAAAAGAIDKSDSGSVDFLGMAEQATAFIKKYLWIDDELLRSAYVDAEGRVEQIPTPILAFSDDYAFLIQALLDLYEVSFDERYVEWAVQLQTKMDALFWAGSGGYTLARLSDSSLFARVQEDQDGAEPCTNSVAVWNLLRLSRLLGSDSYRQRADSTIQGASDRLQKHAFVLPKMCSALYALNNAPPVEVTVIGRRGDADVQKILKLMGTKFLPNKVFVFLDSGAADDSFLVGENARLKQMWDSYKDESGKPCVHICKNQCQLPLHTAEEVEKELSEL